MNKNLKKQESEPCGYRWEKHSRKKTASAELLRWMCPWVFESEQEASEAGPEGTRGRGVGNEVILNDLCLTDDLEKGGSG